MADKRQYEVPVTKLADELASGTGTSRSEFVKALARYAETWVDDRAEEIMGCADRLYGDPAVVMIVCKWYELRVKYDRARSKYVSSLATDKPLGKYHNLYEDELKSYSEAIRLLLFTYHHE